MGPRSRSTSDRASATSRPRRRGILRNLRSEITAGDALLLGTDMVKDEATLVGAYDDSEGVTAAFNLNLLHRLNRELGADFDTAELPASRPLESCGVTHRDAPGEYTRTICPDPGRETSVEFAAFETIHTESSYKFTPNTLRALLDDAGFKIEQIWTDPLQWYALSLAGLY